MKDIWHLEEVDLFEVLCPHKYAEHCEIHPLDCYHKMDFLFMQNEVAKEIYLIAQGKIKIGYYDDAGNEYVKAILNQGEILGERAFLGEQRHRDFAEVMENNTYICKLNLEEARQLARDHRPFGFEINKRIGNRIQKLERRLEILLFKDARMRLIEFIKDLIQEFGQAKNEGVLVKHHLTQSEIATLIGTSRKTASLLLNELEDEGMLTQRRGQFFVPNTERLS